MGLATMGLATLAAWSVIFALSLMLVGGLVLWSYGTRPKRVEVSIQGLEADATRVFHAKLSRWFFSYGLFVIVLGAAILLWAYSVFN